MTKSAGNCGSMVKFTENMLNRKLPFFVQCEFSPISETINENVFRYIKDMRRDTPYLSLFTPNARKYEPKKTPNSNTSHSDNKEDFHFFVTI